MSDSVTLEAINEQRARGWVDFGPEQYCHRCGHRNVRSWFTPSAVWNRVFRHDDEGRQREADYNGIVCPPCFTDLHKGATGDRLTWELRPEEYDERLDLRSELFHLRAQVAQLTQENANLRRKHYCGCAWCCASVVDADARGESHKRTCLRALTQPQEAATCPTCGRPKDAPAVNDSDGDQTSCPNRFHTQPQEASE